MNIKELINNGEDKRIEFKEQQSIKFMLAEKGSFVEAVFERPIKSVGKVSETVAKPSETVGKISDSLLPLSLQEKKIVSHLEKHQRIISKEVEKLLNIKESRSRELLKQMVDKGILVRLGQGRSTYYTLKEEYQ